MGDTAKPYFVKRTKDRGIIDDDDFRRGHPQQDYLMMDDYAKGHSSKMEKGLPKKRCPLGTMGTPPGKDCMRSPATHMHLKTRCTVSLLG